MTVKLIKPCDNCKGKGSIPIVVDAATTAPITPTYDTVCPACNGTGMSDEIMGFIVQDD